MSKRAARRAVAMTGTTVESAHSGGLTSRRERAKTERRRSRPVDGNGASTRRRRQVLRRRIIADKRDRAPDELCRCEQRQVVGSTQSPARRELSDDEVGQLDVAIPADDHHREAVSNHRRQFGIERPALGSPGTSRREYNEVAVDSGVCKKPVNHATLVIARIYAGPKLVGMRRVGAVAECQRPQSLRMMPIGLVSNTLGVKRAPSRSIESDAVTSARRDG